MAMRYVGYNYKPNPATGVYDIQVPRNHVYTNPTFRGWRGVRKSLSPGLTEQEYRQLKERGWKRGDIGVFGETLVGPNKVKYQGKAKKRDVNKKALAGG